MDSTADPPIFSVMSFCNLVTPTNSEPPRDPVGSESLTDEHGCDTSRPVEQLDYDGDEIVPVNRRVGAVGHNCCAGEILDLGHVSSRGGRLALTATHVDLTSSADVSETIS